MESSRKKRWLCEECNKWKAGEITTKKAVYRPVKLHDIAAQILLKLTRDYSKSTRYIFVKFCNASWKKTAKISNVELILKTRNEIMYVSNYHWWI